MLQDAGIPAGAPAMKTAGTPAPLAPLAGQPRLPLILKLFLGICFLLALSVRLYDLTDQPMDFHVDRQLTSMIKARGIYLQWRTDLPGWQQAVAAGQWKSMPHQEPEILEWVTAFAYRISGAENLWIPRLFSICFWMIGGLAVFALARALSGAAGATLAALFYLFLPYGAIASRSFQPDPLNTMFIILGAWALYRWYEHPGWRHGWCRAIVAGLLCGLALLTKVTAGFIIAGAIAGLALGDRGLIKALRDPQMWLIGVLTLLLAALYHVIGLATGYLQSSLFDLRIIPSMLLQPLSYLRWEIKTDQVVGIGAFLLALGGTFLVQPRRGRALLIGMWAGYFVYGAVFIYFFTTHDYYQLPLIPLVAVALAPIGQAIFDRLQSQWSGRWAYAIVLSLLLAGALVNAWNIRTTLKKADYRAEPAFWAGLADQLRGYKVVALTENYNHRLSYYGWLDVQYLLSYGDMNLRTLAGHPADTERMAYIQQLEGRDFFLITQLNELDLQPVLKEVLYSRYKVYQQGERYLLFDLRRP
jgi:hypothetical protein